MNNQVIDAQQDRAFNFFAKGETRFFEHGCVCGGEVDEVITMNQDRRDLRQTTRLVKEQHIFKRKWFGQPAAWIARKELNGVTTSIFRYDQSVMHATFNGSVESDFWFTRHCQLSVLVFGLWSLMSRGRAGFNENDAEAQNSKTKGQRPKSKIPTTNANANLFLPLHHPQHIATQNLVYVGFRMTTTKKLASEVWQIGDSRQILRCGLYPVEIRTNADVIDAHQFHDVLD